MPSGVGGEEQSWAHIGERWHLSRESNPRNLHHGAVQCMSVPKERVCQARAAVRPPLCIPGDQHGGPFFPPLWPPVPGTSLLSLIATHTHGAA